MIDYYKKRRLEKGYIIDAEFTVSVRGKEFVRKGQYSIPLDLESRIDLLGLIERAKNGESIKYTFAHDMDVVFESEEFLQHAYEALALYSKIHHMAKEANGLEDQELSEKIRELVVA